MNNSPQFFSVGENSLTLSFGNEISVETNRKIITLQKLVEKNPFPGLIEIVPAFSSLTVFYDLLNVRKNFPEMPTAFEAVRSYLENLSSKIKKTRETDSRSVVIEFSIADEFSPDLKFISDTKNISKKEIIEIFTSKVYRVFMLGFLPGFAYMGEVDDRIVVPRKDKPRLIVPKGSVGIAGNQTGIYPLESPGGWQIIGRTETELFTPDEENPTFLRAGDLVEFKAV